MSKKRLNVENKERHPHREKPQQRSKPQERITTHRRKFLYAVGAALGAAGLAAYLSPFSQEKQPEGPLGDALREIIDKGFSLPKWSHPSGVSTNNPKDPLVFVGDWHLVGGNSITFDNQLQASYETMQMLLIFHEKGLRDFAFEGWVSGQPVGKFDLTSENGTPLPKHLMRRLLSSDKFFTFSNRVSDREAHPGLARLFAEAADMDCICTGMEDPESYDEYLKTAAQFSTFYSQAIPLLNGYSSNSIIFNYHGDELAELEVGGNKFPVEQSVEILQRFADISKKLLDSDIPRAREEFAMSHAHQVNMIGFSHLPYFRNLAKKYNRSVCTLLPSAAVSYDKQLAENTDQEVAVLVQKLLKEIELRRHC